MLIISSRKNYCLYDQYPNNLILYEKEDNSTILSQLESSLVKALRLSPFSAFKWNSRGGVKEFLLISAASFPILPYAAFTIMYRYCLRLQDIPRTWEQLPSIDWMRNKRIIWLHALIRKRHHSSKELYSYICIGETSIRYMLVCKVRYRCRATDFSPKLK